MLFKWGAHYLLASILRGAIFLGLRKAGTKYHFRPLRGGWIFVSLSMTIIIPESAQNTFLHVLCCLALKQ